MTFYCGNNAKAPDVVSGKKKIGTAYECFRRGVGIGKNLPESELEGEYEPIYKLNIFCGKKFGQEQEGKYERMGSPSECLRKGVGVGKGLARKERGIGDGSPQAASGSPQAASGSPQVARRASSPQVARRASSPQVARRASSPQVARRASSPIRKKQYGFEDIGDSGVPRAMKPKFGFGSSKGSIWPKRFLISAIGFGMGFIISFGILWFIKPNFIKKHGKRSVMKITLFSLLFGFIFALICLVGSVYFLK